MGMMFASVTFQDRAPPLSDICAKITDICSLRVVVLKSDTDEIHDLHATIAFECAQDLTLEALAYRQGAIAQSLDDAFDEPTHRSFMKRVVQGANEPAGTQRVYLRGYLGQEPTLMLTTQLALEALGGTPAQAIPDDERQTYKKPITESELAQRRRETERELRKVGVITVLMLPAVIPMWIIGSLWFLITLPFRIWRAYRALKAIERGGSNTA